jgi:hypothetical protein
MKKPRTKLEGFRSPEFCAKLSGVSRGYTMQRRKKQCPI